LGILSTVNEKILKHCNSLNFSIWRRHLDFAIVHPIIIKPLFTQIFKNAVSFKKVADFANTSDIRCIETTLRITGNLPFLMYKKIKIAYNRNNGF